MHKPVVDFIGIGAKKAATSWIAECLNDHPDIFIPNAKELHFFTKNYEKGSSWYEEQFSGSSARLNGEFSTSYLLDENTPKRIYDFNPNIKLIVSLRNPIERVLSHIKHRQSKGILPKKISVKEIVEANPKGGLIEIGMYAKNLKRYLEYFTREQLHIVLYDDIQSNPKYVIQKLYGHLDVTETFIPQSLTKTFNTSKERNSLFQKLKNKLYLKSRNIIGGKQLIGAIKPFAALMETKSKQVTVVNEEDRIYLFDIFKDDITELEVLFSLDLNTWKI